MSIITDSKPALSNPAPATLPRRHRRPHLPAPRARSSGPWPWRSQDASRIGELLDVLRAARLWLPLPGDGRQAVTGTAVTLPTVSYLGSDFVPAYSSAELLAELAAPAGLTRRPARGRTLWSAPPTWPGCCLPESASR